MTYMMREALTGEVIQKTRFKGQETSRNIQKRKALVSKIRTEGAANMRLGC